MPYRKAGKLLWRLLFIAVVLVWLGSGLAVVAFKQLPRHPEVVQNWAARFIERPLHLERLETDWDGWMPVLKLYRVHLPARGANASEVFIEQAVVRLDLVASLLHGEFLSDLLDIEIRELALPPANAQNARPAAEWAWLFRQQWSKLRIAELRWSSPAGFAHRVHGVNLQLRREDRAQYRFTGSSEIPRYPLAGDFLAGGGSLRWQSTLVWERGGLRSAFGEIQADGAELKKISTGAEQTVAELRSLSSLFQIDAEAAGEWRVRLPGLHLRSSRRHFSPLNLEFNLYRNVARKLEFRGHLEHLEAAEWTGALARVTLLPAAWREALDALKIQGQVQNLRWRYRDVHHWQIEAHVVRWRQQAWRDLPGLRNWGGQLTLEPRGAALHFAEQDLSVALPRLFSRAFQLPELHGSLHLKPVTGQGWHIHTQGLRLATDDIPTLILSGSLDLPPDGRPPLADLRADFEHTPLAAVHRYVPDRIVGKKTMAWLRRGLPRGDITQAGAILRGPLDALPFDHGEGLLELRGRVARATVNYADKWPALTEIEAEVVLRGRALTVGARHALIAGNRVRAAKVEIPELTAKKPKLEVTGQAGGSARNALGFIAASPLRKTVDLGNLDIDGTVEVDLELSIPLSKGPEAIVAGTVHFDGNRVRAQDFGLTLDTMQGELRFTHQGIEARALRTHLFGAPVQMDLSSQKGGNVRTGLTGEADAEFLSRLEAHFSDNPLPPAWRAAISGAAGWRAELELPAKHDTSHPLQIQVASDLKGMALGLPAPFSKHSHEVRPLRVSVDLLHATRAKVIEVDYDGEIYAHFRDDPVLGPRAKVLAGTRQGLATLPRQGIHLAGHLPALSVSAWQALGTGTGHGTGTLPLTLDLRLNQLEAFSQYFHEVRLQGKLLGPHTELHMTAQETEGVLRYRAGKLEAELERLVLRAQPDNGEARGPALEAVDPARLPGLDLACRDMYAAGLDLGAVTLRTRPIENGLALDELRLDSADTTLRVHGYWTRTAAAERTNLYATLLSTDVAGSLGRLGIAADAVQSAMGRFEFVGGWEGNPAQFDLGRVEGTLILATGKGTLMDLEPGVGRVFGLFDLKNVPHRLLLDFSDVVDKGFGFDSIQGEFELAGGYAETDNLRIESPAARVEIRGRTGLVGHTYAQTLVVTPHASNALPVAGALMGGWGGGALALVAQNLLQEELDGTLRQLYRVSGSWEDPLVERITEAGP